MHGINVRLMKACMAPISFVSGHYGRCVYLSVRKVAIWILVRVLWLLGCYVSLFDLWRDLVHFVDAVNPIDLLVNVLFWGMSLLVHELTHDVFIFILSLWKLRSRWDMYSTYILLTLRRLLLIWDHDCINLVIQTLKSIDFLLDHEPEVAKVITFLSYIPVLLYLSLIVSLDVSA